MTEMLPWLMALAITLTGYELPERFPNVEVRPHAWFVEHVCSGHPGCTSLGVSTGGNIILSDRFNSESIDHQGLLLHEIVHVLQFHDRGKWSGCKDRIEREREAYMAQALFLLRMRPRQPVNIAHRLTKVACTDG